VLSELFSVFGERQRELLCVKYGVPHVSNIIRSCDVVGSHALLCFLLFSFLVCVCLWFYCLLSLVCVCSAALFADFLRPIKIDVYHSALSVVLLFS